MTGAWPYPGACWWKFDFHTHTPASKDTEAWQRAVGTSSELTPEAWLLHYMAEEIDCVAITDHNSGAWIDRLKTAYADLQRQAEAGSPPAGFRAIHLFPGVEISVQGGFHLLALFDPDASSRTISDVLARVEYDGTEGDSDGVTRKGAAEVVKIVLEVGGIVIPAHADGDKGLLQVNAGTRSTRLDANTVKQVMAVPGILAMEWVDRNVAPPALLEEAKRSWARVLGSDCHSFRGAAVPGSRYTWVKMARPSLEGLRLALLDGQEVSIRRSDDPEPFSPFDKPEHFIEAIEIKDAQWMGRGASPARLDFNPYFNALVGGRGTGKSTVVHALRLAYGRKGELEPKSEAGETFSRFNQVASGRRGEGGLRENTQITLLLNRDRIRHRLLWRQGQGISVEEWDDALDDYQPSSSQSVDGQRFPVRLFSQGQIASLAGESQQALLSVIDEAAQTQTVLNALEEAKSGFLATRAKVRELQGKLKGREAVVLGLQDVQRKLARFEAAHHAEVLKAYQRTSRQSRELTRQFDNVAELAQQLRSTAEELIAEDLPDGLFDAVADADALAVVQALAQAIAQARAQVVAVAGQLDQHRLEEEQRIRQCTWQQNVVEAQAAYEALKTDLQSQGIHDPSEYGRLVQEKHRLELEARRLDSLQTEYEAARLLTKEQLEQVWQARRAISARRAEFLTQTLADNRFVRIGLVPYGRDARAIERSLRDMLGTPDKYVDDIYAEAAEWGMSKGLVADLLAIELVEDIKTPDTPSFEQFLRNLHERLVRACSGSGDFGSWFNKYLSSEAGKSPEFIDHILCWFPEDGLRVEFSRRGDGQDFQSITQASAGQRAAAMLAFLLAHGDEPLVLDQPEDDLDNHLIYGLIVQQIRANKQRRQLIVVTHNPNIVVNGDAEMIYAFDFNNQCYAKVKGSLQDQAMRDEVCKVMEGGKDAFERRYQRLGREV